MTGQGGHIPVLRDEAVAHLDPRPDGVYVDGTFGGGGYSRAILEAAPDCRVIGIDRDPAAAARAEPLHRDFPGRLTFVPGRFGDLDRLCAERGHPQVDGVVLDIGVSSFQIDEAERGFSFSRSGPLDMRMGADGPTAAEVVNGASEDALADIIYFYGEERAARKVADAIVRERQETGPITTTGRLAEIVRRVVRKSPKDLIDPATRTFQALRIHVNDELGELRRGLVAAEAALRPGGRLVVVTFHSLEDREVKAFLKTRSAQGAGGRLLPGETAGPAPSFSLVTRKAVTCSAAEARANPRARSAKLRAAARTEAAGHGPLTPPDRVIAAMGGRR
jgi:16S rRNA (cytosine1402-N4)-methyltransferase